MVVPQHELEIMLANAESQAIKEWIIQRNQEELRSGTAAYFFKKQGNDKKPAGIYLFMNFGDWRATNLRNPGVINLVPFITRPMTHEENVVSHFAFRLKYHIYTNWDALLEDEALMEVPEQTINELKEYQIKHPLPEINEIHKS